MPVLRTAQLQGQEENGTLLRSLRDETKRRLQARTKRAVQIPRMSEPRLILDVFLGCRMASVGSSSSVNRIRTDTCSAPMEP